jgi:hypothetical protein
MSEDEKLGRYLEKRAEQLGLPTDPAAYQDGGLAEAALCMTLSEADTVVALLRANDVPAWVKSPLSAIATASPMIFPVLVPLGRLADARRLLAEKDLAAAEEGPTPPGEDYDGEETAPEEGQTRSPARGRGRAFAILVLIWFGLGLLLAVAAMIVLLVLHIFGR